ncbi:hypothetical protein AB0I54_31830 [Streptomyces sp. NPDC050625]|uniref:hypothetical protein n=1 Tax=Streptomyces sp. NPDC050625 TaxID=3154629 RepID=UPI00342009CC
MPVPPTDDTPVLPGYIDQRGQHADLRVWCRWCCHWHIHGPHPVGTTAHRVAHCYAPDSGYHATGYRIEVRPVPYSSVIGSVRSANAAQRRALTAGRISDAVRRLREQRPREDS